MAKFRNDVPIMRVKKAFEKLVGFPAPKEHNNKAQGRAQRRPGYSDITPDQALKGRNNEDKNSTNPPPVLPFQGNATFCPHTQGVALGFVVWLLRSE